MPIKFHFRWIPFLAAVAAIAVGISLGQWQTRRAAEKEAIALKLSVRAAAAPVAVDAVPVALDAIEYRRVQIRGEFLRDWPIYLENRPYRGAAGFYVLMPFKLAGSDMHVLVARGWTQRDAADRTRLPRIDTPVGEIALQGIAVRNPGRVLQLGHADVLRPNAIVQNLDIAEFAADSKLRVQPFLLEQAGDTQDGLVRDWPPPSTGIEKHRGYAFQWYGLAATAFLFFVVTGFRRGRK